MTCGHCEMRVKKAIEAIEGVQKVEVNLQNKHVVVEYDERKANLEKIRAAVKEAGYEPM
jgi:copper chaperone